MADIIALDLSDRAIAMRTLARLARDWPPVALDALGEALRQYISHWIGAAAGERAVGAGIARLAHMLAFCATCDPSARPRAILRAALADIGLVPARGGISDDASLDAWIGLLATLADIGGGYSDVAPRAA